MKDFLSIDAGKTFRDEPRGSLGYESPPWVAAVEDDRDTAVEVVRSPGEDGYRGFMVSAFYRRPLERRAVTHATMLRRGSLTGLLRGDARRRAVGRAAEARRRRVGLSGVAPGDDGRGGDRQEVSAR